VRLLRKMTWVELKLFAREPLTLVFTLALPLILLIVLGGVFGNTPGQTDEATGGTVWRGVGPMDYYAPSYIGLVIAAVCLIGVPVQLASYKERGVLRRFRASSVPVSAVIGSQVLLSVVVAAAGSILLVALAWVIYDIHAAKDVAGFILAFLLVVTAFASLGVMLGALLPTARAAQGAGVLLWFGMMFLAGAGPPPEVLPGWMRDVSVVMPLKHATLLLQDVWLGFGWNWTETAVMVGLSAVAGLISARFFRWE